MAGVASIFGEHGEAPCELLVEYLDSKRHPRETIFDQQKALLAAKYRNLRPDVIITSDDDALDFMLAYRDELFPGVPVVFCGVNNSMDSRKDGLEGFIGALEETDIPGTIELILKLHPKIRRLAAVADATSSGRHMMDRLREAKRQFKGRIEFIELAGLSEAELRAALGSLPADAAVLNMCFLRDRLGRNYSPVESAKLVADNAKRPQYSLWDFMVGDDVIGGKVVCGWSQGQNAATMALQILSGASASDIPLQRESPNRFLFDYGALTRAGLSPNVLPPGSAVLRMPESFTKKFGAWILIAAYGFATIAFCIILLAGGASRRKKAQRELSDALAMLQGIFDNSQIGIMQVCEDGDITMANQRFADIAGFSIPEEVVGLHVQTLFESPQSYKEFRHKYFPLLAAGETVRLESRMKRKDGSHISTEVSGKTLPPPAVKGGRRCVVWVVEDITARKTAEEKARRSTQFLDSIVNAVGGPIFVKDAEGRFVLVNEALCDLVGLSRQRLLGSTDYDFFPKDEADHFRTRDNQVIECGQPDVCEEPLTDATGVVRTLVTKKTCYEDESGDRFLVGVIQDVTARKVAEEEARRASRFLNNIVNVLGDPIFVKDADCRFVMGNNALGAITGVGREDIVGHTDFDFFPKEEAEHFQARDKIVLETGETDVCEEHLTDIHGVRREIVTKKNCYVDESGRKYVVGVILDISDRKQSEMENVAMQAHLEKLVMERTKDLERQAEELRRANERLRELDAMKSAFLSSVSHELRTPLTSIRGYSKLLSKAFARRFLPALAPAPQMELYVKRFLDNLDIIEIEADRLTRLINDVLDLNKIEAGKLEWRDTFICPAVLIQNASRTFRGEIARKPGLSLKVNYSKDQIPGILVDPDKIMQVLVNLLGNAVKFTRTGAIRVTAIRENGEMRFGVSDTGSGIAKEEQANVFERFQQVGCDTLKEKPKGTGLGLAICKQIVEHYEGRIWVESEPGRGSDFYFAIPLARRKNCA